MATAMESVPDAPRDTGLREYVKEILREADYLRDEACGCVVASAPSLPCCVVQADNFEDARDSLRDAVELLIVTALRCGEALPVVRGARLAAGTCRAESCVLWDRLGGKE